MGLKSIQARLTRGAVPGLRYRLTASYVLLLALVLTSVGLIFRQALGVAFHMHSERVLAEQWSALHGYLRIQDGELVWLYKPGATQEEYDVGRLRRVLMLAEPDGDVLEISYGYKVLGRESKEQIAQVMKSKEPVDVRRADHEGRAHLVRMGVLRDEGKEYFVALGLPIEETMQVPDRLMRVYFLMMPLMLLAIGVLGWYAADRGLRPLEELTAGVQQVSGGDLSLRLSPRGTGDELDTLIKTFNGMMERLEQSFGRARRFSADASHELRTPLTVIRGQLEVAMLTAETKEQYRKAIEAALEDVEQLVAIVNGLLYLSEAESGQIRLQKEPLELSAWLGEWVKRLQAEAQAKGVACKCEIEPQCPVLADRQQLERMVQELFSNAVKYTPAGGWVSVALKRADGAIGLRVANSGAGIGAEHLPHVFERFYRVREGENCRTHGVGLGLTAAEWIVRAHGGRIEVASERGGETAFLVVLPAWVNG
ncbi:MAG: HAMP domain-containing protein [Acidobacteria bacterium]|nr:HAMP domain-containing protein [Acidobacteriota bacterium]